MSRYFKTEAIVVKSRDISDRDRIVTFFSPVRGKFDALCRGSRQIKSSSVGRFEPFNILLLQITLGKNLDIITQSQLVQGFKTIREDLTKTMSALYMINHVDSFMDRNEENPVLYHALCGVLRSLAENSPPELTERIFEAKLIEILGYRPIMDSCAICGSGGFHSDFSYSHGGAVCVNCAGNILNMERDTLAPSARGALKFMFDNRVDIAGRLKINQRDMADIKRLMRKYIQYHLPGKTINGHCYDRVVRDNEKTAVLKDAKG